MDAGLIVFWTAEFKLGGEILTVKRKEENPQGGFQIYVDILLKINLEKLFLSGTAFLISVLPPHLNDEAGQSDTRD